MACVFSNFVVFGGSKEGEAFWAAFDVEVFYYVGVFV